MIMTLIIFILPIAVWIAWVIWTKLRGPSKGPIQKHSNVKSVETYDKAAFIQNGGMNAPPRSGGLF